MQPSLLLVCSNKKSSGSTRAWREGETRCGAAPLLVVSSHRTSVEPRSANQWVSVAARAGLHTLKNRCISPSWGGKRRKRRDPLFDCTKVFGGRNHGNRSSPPLTVASLWWPSALPNGAFKVSPTSLHIVEMCSLSLSPTSLALPSPFHSCCTFFFLPLYSQLLFYATIAIWKRSRRSCTVSIKYNIISQDKWLKMKLFFDLLETNRILGGSLFYSLCGLIKERVCWRWFNCGTSLDVH